MPGPSLFPPFGFPLILFVLSFILFYLNKPFLFIYYSFSHFLFPIACDTNLTLVQRMGDITVGKETDKILQSNTKII